MKFHKVAKIPSVNSTLLLLVHTRAYKQQQSQYITEANAAVLQQVAEVVKHGFLVLTADSTEVTEKSTTVGHHFRKGDLLGRHKTDIYRVIQYSCTQCLLITVALKSINFYNHHGNVFEIFHIKMF